MCGHTMSVENLCFQENNNIQGMRKGRDKERGGKREKEK